MGKKSTAKTSTTNKTIYGNTTTSNPYVTSQTNNNGTTTYFNSGTAFDSINNFVNKNMDKLLEEYLNPNLNSITNQAKLNSFKKELGSETYKNLENNIINPLSKRNMIRSSQATDLYKNLSATNANKVSDYTNDLLKTSQSDVASMLGNLMSLYMNGYGAITDNQAQSLLTSQGNATRAQNSSATASTLDYAQMASLATQLAMMGLGIGV